MIDATSTMTFPLIAVFVLAMTSKFVAANEDVSDACPVEVADAIRTRLAAE